MPASPTHFHAPAKLVTLQDIADALGIHRTTVSKAMTGRYPVSPALRQKILDYANEVGYEPDVGAQRLRLSSREKSHLICLCSGYLTASYGSMTMDKMVRIQKALFEMGFEVPFNTAAKFSGESADAQISLFRHLRRQRPQAIICAAHYFQDAAIAELEHYQREGGIVVAFDLPISLDCDQVLFDRTDNAYQAARYLLERGHRYLGIAMGHLVGPRDSKLNTTQNQRIPGYHKALREWSDATGEQLLEPWVFEVPDVEDGGVVLARHYMELKHRPSALCIVNDHVTLAFMSELLRLGVRIPQDVSIVGQSNQFLAAHLTVPLTSVTQPVEEIVQATLARLLSRLQGDTSPSQTIAIRGELIERQSVVTLTGS